MGSFTDYLENAVLNHVFKNSAYVQPSNIYVALSTTAISDDGSGITEPSGNSYARVQHNDWTTSTSGELSNDGAVTFPEATGEWGTITHAALFDAETGGNMLAYSEVPIAKPVQNGDQANFKSGEIVITLD